jgi:hypothetical protein
MDAEFLEEQFAELGLSREIVKKMSLSEVMQYAKKIHGEETKVVGSSRSPVSGNYYLATDETGRKLN